MTISPFRIVRGAFAFLLALPFAAEAGVIATKTLTRLQDPVVVTGADLPGFAGLAVNNADATQAPNQIFVWAYDGGTTSWRQVVFQIDEINNANPTAPPPVCTNGSHIGRGPNHMEADDGLWDSNDELVFLSGETGDRVSLDEWAPGASATASRYEIAVTDPLDSTKKGWAYVFRHDTLPTWRTDDYIAWNEATNAVSATNYVVDYVDSDTNAVSFNNMNVTVAGGGTGANLVQKSKLYWYGGFALSCGSDETQIRTQQTITGGGCVTMTLPWYAKDGRVRVLRYFIWSPYCTWVTNGIGMWPSTHVYYYPSFWREDSHVNFHGGSGHTDYWWASVNHANTTNMTFYDSNGESCTIDGTSETQANTPLWTWYQVSSAYGSYIQVLRDQYKEVSPDSRRNLYTDSGTGSRGDAGYRIENPTENASEPDRWHQFWFFYLPAGAPNQGAAYNTNVDNPLGRTSTGQAYTQPPGSFDGILSAVDVDACADSGVQVGWDNVVVWNDGCSSPCSSRRFVVSRNGATVYTETNVANSSWTDLGGVNGTTYAYGVEACNQNNNCTALGTTISARDWVAAAPALSSSATLAVDADACVGTGVTISWAPPSSWGDGGAGTQSTDLYWDADGYAAPIATSVASPFLYDAPDGVSRSYRVRVTNGCGLSTDYAASSAVADAVGAAPTLPADPATLSIDVESCSASGIQVSWNPVATWGDGGQGSRKYDLWWSGNAFASPLQTNVTSPAFVLPPDSAPYTYRIRATNGCGLTADFTDGIVADGSTAPAFTGIQSVVDANLCAASSLTIAWTDVEGDGASGWNDGGVGAGSRAYRIYRDGVEITSSPQADGVSSTTDTPPLPNTTYTYTVRAFNGNGCWTNANVSLPGVDRAVVTPAASPAATVATDKTCSAGTGVDITWDAVTDWGDSGSGASSRRYLLYWSGNGFASPIGSYSASATSASWAPPTNVPYTYRIVARNGCGASRSYANSAATFDKTSCSPPCTLVVNADFNTGAGGFGQTCNGSSNFWALTAGAGRAGTQAWRCTLPSGNSNRNLSAALEQTAASSIPWTTDVKLRFWADTALNTDDAAVVQLWTNDSAAWRKVQVFPYPQASATVPNSIALNCATDVGGGTQPAFQGTFGGAYYEGRLDSLLTASTTQIKVRFKAASGNTSNTSTWTIDDVQLGYGITDGVWSWSKLWDPAQGVLPASGGQAVFAWDDGGNYVTTEFRIYRSENPAAIRTDPTSSLVHTEADTDAAVYSWTTTEVTLPPGGLWCYQVYGWKPPCGESNAGEN